MKKLLYLSLLLCSMAHGQLWSGILSGPGVCTTAPSSAAAACAINWSQSGLPSGIPVGTQSGSTITSTGSDQTSAFSSALSSCGGTSSAQKFIQLAAGTFTIAGTITLPSYCTLVGAGANSTFINATGTGSLTTCEPDAGDGDTQQFCLGSGGVSYSPVSITSGATAGSTSLTLASVSGMAIGGYLVVTDTNDSWVTVSGGEGTCNWCDGGFTSNGTRARGQIVEIENISGSVVTISPGLYTAYANTPTVVYTTMTKYAGIENLSITGANNGLGSLVGFNLCAYCFEHNVRETYSANNFVTMAWGYRDQIDSSYFSNSYDHTSGSFDGTVDLIFKTSGSLIQNNIIERGHVGLMMEWGAAGNVVDANFIMAGFDTSNNPADWSPASVNMHGAHPQFNLFENNVGLSTNPDQIWGSSSHNTYFRNWWRGTSPMCSPLTGSAGPVVCSPQGWYTQSGKNSWLMPVYSYAEDISHWSWYDNFVGDIVGSANQQGLPGFSGTPQSNVAILSWTSGGCSSGCRNNGGGSPAATAYNFTFGFGELADDGSGSGCDGGTSPCHSTDAFATSFLYNAYTFTNTTTNCLSGGSSSSCPTSLPASFFLSSKPAFWGSLPWPSIGPDVTGGTGPGGHTSLTQSIPAQACYLGPMGGVDGGTGSPLAYDIGMCASTPPPPVFGSPILTLVSQ
jgi:Pectate lyase superfamily protein